MTADYTLHTARLVLRCWRGDDFPRFVAMSSDPAVMRYLAVPPGDGTVEERLIRVAHSYQQGFDDRGIGRWVIEVPGVTPFAGIVGLTVVTWPVPFPHRDNPPVEIAWRFMTAFHGHGYATEAAEAALAFAFTRIGAEQGYPDGLREVVAYAASANAASRRVMDKLGIVQDSEATFLHPMYAPDSIAREQVVYRFSREEWEKAHQSPFAPP